MPIDPSIIGNVMVPSAPQLPDVNAMMQTQQRGMEGMIQMERQRAADALSAQERETDAAAKAMAPAIASAFSDPSDEGLDIALSMVPAQYQAAAMAQIDQLRAVPDLNRRKDIIRAGLVQDDYGRAILAQLEPTANMRLQADTAAQAQALRMRELQLQERQAAQGAQMTPYQQAQIDLEREKLAAQKDKGTAEEVKRRLDAEKRAKDIAFAVEQVETAAAENGLLDQATGSYLGNLIDTAAQTVGYGTEGAIANARLKPIADLVLKLVPRFEGPQAIPDVQSYKEAAGDLANPNLPTSVKKAAAAEIVRLLRAYPSQFDYTSDGGAGDNVIDFNDLGD